MIESQAMQNRGVEVEHRDWITDDVVAEVIGLADSDTAFDTTASQPKRETARMMVASVIVCCEFSLRIHGAPEFAAPNDQSIFE